MKKSDKMSKPWIRVLGITETEDPKSKRLTFFLGSPKFFKSNVFRIEIRKRGELLADFEFCQTNMDTLLGEIGYTMVKKEWKQKVDKAITLAKDIRRLEQVLKIFEELAEIEKRR